MKSISTKLVLWGLMSVAGGGSLAHATTDLPGGSAVNQLNLHPDRKSTRLNSSHSQISYAVFCLKKKKKKLAYNNSYKNLTCSHSKISSDTYCSQTTDNAVCD